MKLILSLIIFFLLLTSCQVSSPKKVKKFIEEKKEIIKNNTKEELKEKIFNCMSQRAAANIKDEMEVLGPIRLTEVQEAQKAVINVARTMSDEGTIVLAGRGGDDFV